MLILLSFFVVEGLCTGILSGTLLIEVTAEAKGTAALPANAQTGWNSVTRMHVEEVRMSHSVEAGKEL